MIRSTRRRSYAITRETLEQYRDITKPSTVVRQHRGEGRPTATDVQDIEATTEVDGGNGQRPALLWEMVTSTPTFRMHSLDEPTEVQAELADTMFKLYETEEEKQRLSKIVSTWRSVLLSSEALATSDNNAMTLLAQISDSEGLSVTRLVEMGASLDQWLSVVRLAQAGLVNYLGSYIYLTDRARQILDAAANAPDRVS